MNPAILSTALSVGKTALEKFNDFRDEKAREAYTALETAAKNVDSATEDWFPESRKQAGFVTQAAHNRLERAKADFAAASKDVSKTVAERTEELKKEAKTSRKKLSKAAAKKAKKVEKRAEKKAAKLSGKKKGGFGKFTLFAALISAVAAAVYFILQDKEAPSTKPPRVEEHAGDKEKTEGSTLVYSSTSETSASSAAAGTAGAAAEKPAGDLAEEGVTERDEELLGSIDEQLKRHAEEAEEGKEAKAEPDTSRVTDDREDEGRHRLAGDAPTPNLMPETIAEGVENEDLEGDKKGNEK